MTRYRITDAPRPNDVFASDDCLTVVLNPEDKEAQHLTGDLVCNRPMNHVGDHYDGWDEVSWVPTEPEEVLVS